MSSTLIWAFAVPMLSSLTKGVNWGQEGRACARQREEARQPTYVHHTRDTERERAGKSYKSFTEKEAFLWSFIRHIPLCMLSAYVEMFRFAYIKIAVTWPPKWFLNSLK